MSGLKKIKTALVSVYHKEGLDEIITKLHEDGVEFLSTGGTRQFIESLGYPCKAVEDLTSYPSILGGRVKTLHPKIFGGILCRRELEQDRQQIEEYEIPEIDLVIVDLYPFEATVASGADEATVIEKIDIGGISLIRAAAKNYNDVVIVASQLQYKPLLDMLMEHGATSSLEERRWMAKEAFAVSSHYESAIFNYFDGAENSHFVVLQMIKRLFAMEKILIRKVSSTVIWMLSLIRFTEKKFLTITCWISMQLLS
jgi:phosphoribosylaminoimidazolecarboxamide formyltransferase/IMP cyclohydrolase